jgi:hypothetical protein
MESTNGTWVNEQRLSAHTPHPLKDGDLLRLGQIGLYIYFNEVAVPVKQVVLTAEVPPLPKRLTPDYLAHTFSPYLTALADVQMVADTILKRESAVEVRQLCFEAGKIILSVEGMNEAVAFAEDAVAEWRRVHPKVIAEMRELDDMLRWLRNLSMQEKIEDRREQIRLATQSELLQLGFKFLRDILPEPAELSHVVYVEQLLRAFHTLAFSALGLSTVVEADPVP